ncbi:MAG: hypothetical protein K6E98_07610 [Lachnospiraceae bacterium]|nr:hypothetical protein [Lachnospiraceae bacterium]
MSCIMLYHKKHTDLTGTSDNPDTIPVTMELKNILKYTFIGISIPAVLFLLYLITHVSIPDFIKGIPYVLSDEEHGTTFIYPIKKFFIGINEVFGYGAYAAYLLIIASVFTSFFNIFKNRVCYLLIFTADLLLFIDLFICSIGHTGYIQTALCLFALPLYFMTPAKDLKIFYTFILGGMILSLVYSYSSNGYLYVLSIGHFVSSIGCLMAIENFIKTLSDYKLKPVFMVGCTAVICTVIVQTMMLRMVNVYRDAPIQMLNFRITDGPAKGLYTTADHYVSYNVVYSTLQKYCTSAQLSNPVNNSIFITKLLPFGYMCTDLKCAAPTTWRTAFNSVRLKPYYDMNPDRTPDMILVLNESYGSYLTCGDVEADPAPNENEINGYLLEYVNSNNYEQINVPCGMLYKRR